MRDMGFGFDCSSIAELVLSRQVGGRNEDIMFTSNNTTEVEFNAAAAEGGCVLNLDDISLIEKVPVFPELICFRYNPAHVGPVMLLSAIRLKLSMVSATIRLLRLIVSPRKEEPSVLVCIPWSHRTNSIIPIWLRPRGCYWKLSQWLKAN